MTELPPDNAYPDIMIGKQKVDVRELLTIDSTDLVNEYQNTHHWIVVVGYRIAIMQASIVEKKRSLSKLEARLSRTTRAAAEKRATEALIKSAILMDPTHAEQQSALDALEHTKAVYTVVYNGLENKLDAVINMGAELRKRRHL